MDIEKSETDLNKYYVDPCAKVNVHDENGKIIGTVKFGLNDTVHFGLNNYDGNEYAMPANNTSIENEVSNDPNNQPNPFSLDDLLRKKEEKKKEYEAPEVDTAEWIDSETAKAFRGADIVRIQEGIKEIGNSAFSHFNDMKQLILPSSLIRISPFAFHDCSKLKFVEIPENVEIIDDHAFFDCHDLKFVILPKNLKYVGYFAFGGCENLKYMIKGKHTIFEEQVFSVPHSCTDNEIIFDKSMRDFSRKY